MKIVAQSIYESIDNNFYDAAADSWWQPGSFLNLIQSSINPARVEYFKGKWIQEPAIDRQRRRALEVGCGGGILCEEIARAGFDVTGIDLSARSLQTAACHAAASDLHVKYDQAAGEALPYPDSTFDSVYCCDVLEHVRDRPKVVSEISRVLKPGGLFCYDTLNRTIWSKMLAINIAQVWTQWAFAPPNLHVWKMFIKPGELKKLLAQHDLAWQEHVGLRLNIPYLKIFRDLRRRAKGELTYGDLGQKYAMVKNSSMSMMYMGYAVKEQKPDRAKRTD